MLGRVTKAFASKDGSCSACGGPYFDRERGWLDDAGGFSHFSCGSSGEVPASRGRRNGVIHRTGRAEADSPSRRSKKGAKVDPVPKHVKGRFGFGAQGGDKPRT